jgi:hypothetical protein
MIMIICIKQKPSLKLGPNVSLCLRLVEVDLSSYFIPIAYGIVFSFTVPALTEV